MYMMLTWWWWCIIIRCWDVWWWNDLIWRCSILRCCACIKCHDALWRQVFKYTTLVNVNDDECMKANACMLLKVMCERCIGLCLKDDLKIKTMGTSFILYVNIHRDTSSFMMISANPHSMMIMVFMGSMTPRVSLTSGRRYRLVTRESPGGVGALWGFSLTHVGHVHIHSTLRLKATPIFK